MQLFLDCDGVLADFDRSAEHILGMPPRAFQKRHGLPAFWKRLAKAGDFYATLPLLPDARHLFQAVAHLHPIILTGCPRGNWAEAQKERWVRSEEHTSELQSLMRNSYAVFCLKKKKKLYKTQTKYDN